MPRRAADSLVVPIPTTRLHPPPGLSEGAKAEFIRIVTCERPEHFKPSDLPLLTQYCESSALAARATLELQRDDCAPRWLQLWENANRNMVALAARLRLCPQSRQPNNPRAARPASMSYYERAELEAHDEAE